MTSVSTLAGLSRTEWRLFGAALARVVAARLALWVLPSATILRRVRALGIGRPRPTDATVDPALVIWAVEAASQRVPRATCLTQAIAAQQLLQRYGFAAQLRLGVARDSAGVFRAHAWLERDGRIVMGRSGVSELTALPDLPPGEPAARLRQLV